MRTFKVEKDYFEEGFNLFKKSNIKIEPGLTVLVGCNGTGKTTLLNHIKSELKRDNIIHLSFDNLIDGGANARQVAGIRGNMEWLATATLSSEGENIIMNIANMAQKIGATIRKNTDADELWILLDAIDSGLSVDNIIEIKNLFNLIIEDGKKNGTDVYIIISANEYELARNEQCFDVYNCEYITFKDYEHYRKFIIRRRRIKDKRYETAD